MLGPSYDPEVPFVTLHHPLDHLTVVKKIVRLRSRVIGYESHRASVVPRVHDDCSDGVEARRPGSGSARDVEDFVQDLSVSFG